MKSHLKFLIITGLVLGGALGMAGTFVGNDHLRSLLWAIDGTGLVAATSLLAVYYIGAGEACVAAGFLVYALGEAVMLGGNAGSLEASVPSFAAGIALWAAGMLLTSIPKVFAMWTRIAALIATVLFAIVSARIAMGEDLTPLSKPLPNYAYPFLVITLAGWIWKTAKAE